MNRGLIVKYNNSGITPVPLVSRSYQFIDYGGRWGQVEQIDLTCYITGITTYQTEIDRLNTLFGQNFKTLTVEQDDNSLLYQWDNIVLQEVSVSQNNFHPNGLAPYNAKFISYQIPSGVLDPSNEYSFSQSEDGTVTVNHKISARGVRTANSPIDNAINFVSNFLRKNPYTGCAPTFITNSTADAVLMSVQESIDRSNGTYSVNEIYKFVTGQGAAYLKTTNLSVGESPTNDYVTVDLSVTLQGSPVNKNLSTITSAAQSLDLMTELTSYGLSTSNIHRESYSINLNSGACSIEIKGSFVSGVGSDMSGHFDYAVSLDSDLITDMNIWKIDGEYMTRGPMNLRRSQVASFKSSNQGNGYATYLKSLVTSSPLYSAYQAVAYPLNITQITVSEDTGRATLRLSATFSDYDNYGVYVQPKYVIEVEPSRWIYEMVPSANIEGHYIIQDLQMKNQAKIRLAFNAVLTGESSLNYSSASDILNILSGIYLGANSFLTSETTNSGVSSISIERQYMGSDTMTTGILTSKVYGGYGNAHVRQRGHKFGF
jgi:hypothetical protein